MLREKNGGHLENTKEGSSIIGKGKRDRQTPSQITALEGTPIGKRVLMLYYCFDLFVFFWVSMLWVFMALGINQVTYSNRKFCRSVCPGFATLGTSR